MSYRTQAEAMRGKLERLEQSLRDITATKGTVGVGVAKQLQDGQQQSEDWKVPDPSPSAAARAGPAGAKGHMSISSDGQTFMEPAHWESMMNDIAELKSFLGPEMDEMDEASHSPQSTDNSSPQTDALSPPDLIFSQPASYRKHDLLNALPSKVEADSLVAAWLRSVDTYKRKTAVPA